MENLGWIEVSYRLPQKERKPMTTVSKYRSAMIAVVLLVFGPYLLAAEPETEYAPGPGDVPQTITSPLGKPMTLKFHDEFDAVPDKDGQPYIDRSKWQTTFWQGSSERTLIGNGETQYYMDKDYAGKNNLPVEQRPNPFSFAKPGILTITASKTPKELWGNYWMGEGRCITSGMLCSDRRFTFKYGYVEGRFKIPTQRGTWPAFWMLPNDPSLSTAEVAPTTAPPEVPIAPAIKSPILPGSSPVSAFAITLADTPASNWCNFSLNNCIRTVCA